MRKIIFTRPDGGLSVVHPVINTLGEIDGFTEEEAEARAWAKLPKDAINPRFVEAADIPTDRTFRNAWEDTGAKIQPNMPKARSIHRDRIRELRKPKLEALDAAYLRADEIGDIALKASISLKKQALRDAPQYTAIDAATTPEELKVAVPPILSE